MRSLYSMYSNDYCGGVHLKRNFSDLAPICVRLMIVLCVIPVAKLLVRPTVGIFISKKIGSFHAKSPNALNGSDSDFDETAYIWSLSPE